ncbi:MAG: acetyl-CoA carboxylase, carboxyltransferase subunit beta [Firmicutes bacterium]|nr:acetyl-CoA carboxylase, carboxyltransferase subunit beta [Bacillota bacterium]
MIIDKLKKNENLYVDRASNTKNNKKSNSMIGKWIKCNKCSEILYLEDVHNNLSVCPNCDNHFRLSSRRRILQVVDEGTFEEFDMDMEIADPLRFPGYAKKIESLRKATNIKEGVKTGTGEINGIKVVIGVMDANFMMGSMGSLVGEMVTRAMEEAVKQKLPLVIFCASGGARMQEGIVSLMQMAKTSAALAKLDEAGLLYINVLTDPTTGGVTASFASLGDITLAEPRSLIGFAGPRVIEQTMKQKLPDGFQSAEFLLEHGFVDEIVHRKDMKRTLTQILELHR